MDNVLHDLQKWRENRNKTETSEDNDENDEQNLDEDYMLDEMVDREEKNVRTA